MSTGHERTPPDGSRYGEDGELKWATVSLTRTKICRFLATNPTWAPLTVEILFRSGSGGRIRTFGRGSKGPCLTAWLLRIAWQSCGVPAPWRGEDGHRLGYPAAIRDPAPRGGVLTVDALFAGDNPAARGLGLRRVPLPRWAIASHRHDHRTSALDALLAGGTARQSVRRPPRGQSDAEFLR